MADISTGRQRGIVPFVDETTGRLPDQYLPQGVIDLQGDLEQAVTDAGASATEAKASAASATQSASAAAQSAESASGDAAAAKTSAGEAASSASAAKASETAAASSATAAAESKDAAKASETAAAQSAQTATEQVSSIGDSVERAAASATAAQRSATEAASSASNASQSASAASTSASQAGESASQASGFASTASQAATTATGAASNASASATAAQQSASDASASASAAKASETNAASSASTAKVSETNAADSATAAQQAVDGFGLAVGTTTTGDPGTDAAVEIQKTGNKYTANFTIPRGDKGADGVNENVPLGTASGVVAQASDAYPALPRKVQVHGATSGGNSVEPTKLVVAGKNIYDKSYAALNPYWGRGEFDENGDLLIYSNDNAINSYAAFNIVSSDYQFPEGEWVVSALLPNIPNSRLEVYNRTDGNSALRVDNAYPNVTSGTVTINPEKEYTVNIVFNNGTGTAEAVKVSDIQIERGTVQTSYSKPETTFTNLPSGISLADGDTLTIDRDGTTRIVHSEGEPTVLDNVTLPELPAPTFNVYTTGGNVPPTVDVDYERDVNLVLQAMEAKIAALEVNQTIMEQGA